MQITISPVQVTNSLGSTNTNSVTVSSMYNGPISSGQVSVLTSGSSNVTSQTIPIGSTNHVSVSDSISSNLTTVMGSGELLLI